ncbi:hypothetical protein ACT7DM_29950 [Bacillus cereus]
MENQENTQLSEFDFDRTVFINSVGVSAIDFKIGEDEQEELIESGKIAVNDYFKRYNNSNSMKNKTDGT